MTPDALTYWLAGTIPAAGTWTLNLILRGEQALKSSAADWALMVLAFDGAIAIGIQDLICFVPNAAVREVLPALVPALIFLSLTIWAVVVRWLEPGILAAPSAGRSRGGRIALFMGMWVCVGSNICFHYYLLGRGFNVG